MYTDDVPTSDNSVTIAGASCEAGLGSIPFSTIGTDLEQFVWILSLLITLLQFVQLIFFPLFGDSLFRFATRSASALKWPRNPKERRAREQALAYFERRRHLLLGIFGLVIFHATDFFLGKTVTHLDNIFFAMPMKASF